MTLTETLAAFVADLDLDAVPADTIEATKQRLLDTVGVAWAGSTAPGCEGARKVALAERCGGVATLWASGERVSTRGAAFVNGMHAAALDYDSVYERGSVHPDIVVLPAAWAVAEEVGADGRALLTAVVAGCEVACRLGAANKRNNGWFYTATHGVFGAAAAAAKLAGLDAAGITDALGLALSRAAGSQQALVEKSLAKRAQSGFAAEAGVFAAQLAAAGVSGPREAIEGRFGYHALYGEGDRDRVVAELGRRFEAGETAIKKYPSCTANHVPIDLLIGLAEANDIPADAVADVTVRISPFAEQLVGAPFDPSANPQVAAQFSVHYSAASALMRRRLGIAEIQDAAVLDPAVGAFVPKVSVVVDRENEGKFAPAAVSLRTTGGKRFESRLDHVPGTRQNPMSDSALTAKFRDCAAFGLVPLTAGEADALAGALRSIETVGALDDVFAGIHS